MKNKIIIFLALLLMALNFGLQSFDILTFSFNKSGFYIYDASSMEAQSFIVNKLLRLSLNLACLSLLLIVFSGISNKQFFWLVGGMLILCALDLNFAFSESAFLVTVHRVLNPVIYSPLLGIVYLGSLFIFRKF